MVTLMHRDRAIVEPKNDAIDIPRRPGGNLARPDFRLSAGKT